MWARLPCLVDGDHSQDLLRGCSVSWCCWDATPPGRAWSGGEQPTIQEEVKWSGTNLATSCFW